MKIAPIILAFVLLISLPATANSAPMQDEADAPTNDEKQSIVADITLTAVARAATYIGYALALGALAFQWLVVRQPAIGGKDLDTPLLIGATANLAGVGILLAVGAYEPASSTSVISWSGFASLSLAFALASASMLWFGQRKGPGSKYHIIAVAWIVAVAWGARLGHAGSWASIPIEALHGISVAAWVGCLAIFCWTLWQRDGVDAQLIDLARRFGTVAAIAVVLIAGTGLAMSAMIVGPDLINRELAMASPWRRILSTKIALTGIMVVLALVNRRLLRRGVQDDSSSLRKVVLAELMVGALIIGLAGFLVTLPTPQ